MKFYKKCQMFKEKLWAKNLYIILLFIILVSGCDYSKTVDSEREVEMTEKETLDGFYDLFKSEQANTGHSLDDITKVMYDDVYEMANSSCIAINVGDKGMFINRRIHSSLKFREFDYIMSDSDINEVRAILEKYDVMNWEDEYGTYIPVADADDPNISIDGGGGWTLVIQFSDNTVKRINGFYDGDEEYPENYEEFVKELEEFVDSKEPNAE